MRKKLTIVGLMIGSALMTAGYLQKSGAAARTKRTITGWYAEREYQNAAEEAAIRRQKEAEAQARAKHDALCGLPVDNGPPLEFRGQLKKVSTVLRTGVWSRKIVVPMGQYGAHFSIEVNPHEKGYYIWFEEDKDPIELGNRGETLPGIKSGKFWLLGKEEGQTATVEYELKKATLKDVKNPW